MNILIQKTKVGLIRNGVVLGLIGMSITACNQKPAVSNTTASEQVETQKTEPAVIIDNKTIMSDSIKQQVFTTTRDENCGCCSKWITHAKDYGLKVEDKVLANYDLLEATKNANSIPERMRSCHTTVSDNGFVFEGHVPVKFMDKFLQNPPKDAIGLSVPAMPLGAPGMEVGEQFLPYKIMLMMKDGTSTEYAMVNDPSEQY